MRSILLCFALRVSLVHSAINLDGTQAVDSVTEDDPSPIGNINTYYPDQHDCPVSCIDFSNMHGWIPYLTVERLRRCQKPMLLQFSVTQPLDDPATSIYIRSCTLGSVPTIASSGLGLIENPKKEDDLFVASLESAPACAVGGVKAQDNLELAESSAINSGGGDILGLLEGMQKFFNTKDNCDENFLFAYHKQTVASVYIGAGLGKQTVNSAVKALAERLRTTADAVRNHTITQLCGTGRLSDRVFGISIDTSGDIYAVQRAAFEWSKGDCVATDDGKLDLKSTGKLSGVKVFEIAGAPTISGNGTFNSTQKPSKTTKSRAIRDRSHFHKHGRRATCRYVQVVSGDSCASLASKCGISAADFTKFNTKSNLCSTLMPSDYVCCSTGAIFTIPKPKPNEDGTCATYLIKNGDTCDMLARQYNVTIAELEKWNKGKTWAWTECKEMLLGYNMCLSSGSSPIPPPQHGTECGPMVPGTQQPTDSSISIAALNPCPLKACCSNWGYCGVFPSHCDINAPTGGGPGSKKKGFQNTCISNCGMELKAVSGPPASFQRIGYYESWNLERDCLWLQAKNSNTDGTYTHIHWGFLDIDPVSWKPIIKDTKKQWAGFKALKNVKRIVSFGGWAYSTEPATYGIIRAAILNNRDTFASNIAQFINDEGLDGVDIDWEYPGAPDILVGGQVIGQKADGVNYLKFLTVLKQKIGTGKSVSIAAPASYWYLKAFPIDRIAAVIDYIVYMTYDLHGQWDYGNVNAFDSCSSGKCIRSHVNLTETLNTLAIITKAGVPNNKIFVGEASYGRSFHMAVNGCWGPTCDFTGSRTQSQASVGRCTKTSGYIAAAEINEIVQRGVGAEQFHDETCNTDVLLYKGDYISYMTPITKDTRREKWKKLNFAGSIDWAVDLQSFTSEDWNAVPGEPPSGEEGCVGGRDNTVNTGTLCEFSCDLGFCPEPLCSCTVTGRASARPAEKPNNNVAAIDELDVDLNRLCKFACKYGFCPSDVCITIEPESNEEEEQSTDDWAVYDETNVRWGNSEGCILWKDNRNRDVSTNMCKKQCQPALDKAAQEGRTSNYGCMGFWPLDEPIPWYKPDGVADYSTPGKCVCDNMLINEIADTVIEALPVIAQIGCFILMSTLKLLLDVGLELIPGVGKPLSVGLDMATTAAEMVNYVYGDEENPEGAFSWWLSPCGGSGLVPDEIKRIFDILSGVPSGISSFVKPKNIPEGSGRKGDGGNPTDQSTPRSGGGRVSKPKPKCKIRAGEATKRIGVGKNTLRSQSCVADKTVMEEIVITSVTYAANAVATPVKAHCEKSWSQACFHYSSVTRANPRWATLTCPQEAAGTAHRLDAKATSAWSSQHRGAGWQKDPATNKLRVAPAECDRDEYPPAYLLSEKDPAYIYAGKDTRGQSVRYLPDRENKKAGTAWKGACFSVLTQKMSDKKFEDSVALASNKQIINSNLPNNKGRKSQTFAGITVYERPEFSWSSWGHAGNVPLDDGLWENVCWPRQVAAKDPGYVLLTYDPYYGGKAPPYNYAAPYVQGANGS